MRKYINKPLFGIASIISILSGLEMPFNTMTYSYVFYLIEKHAINLIFPSVLVVMTIYALFGLIGYVKSYVINQNVFKINSSLKNNYVLKKMNSINVKDKDF